MVITDRNMQAAATGSDQWLIEAGARGAGRFVGRITPSGERLFYFRYTDPTGNRVRLPIGTYEPKGRGGLKLAEGRAIANEWARLYQAGARDLRQYLADLRDADVASKQAALTNAETAKREADEAGRLAELEQQRRLTVRQLFDRWAETELVPHVRTDGRRTGRKDSGTYTRECDAFAALPAGLRARKLAWLNPRNSEKSWVGKLAKVEETLEVEGVAKPL